MTCEPHLRALTRTVSSEDSLAVFLEGLEADARAKLIDRSRILQFGDEYETPVPACPLSPVDLIPPGPGPQPVHQLGDLTLIYVRSAPQQAENSTLKCGVVSRVLRDQPCGV